MILLNSVADLSKLDDDKLNVIDFYAEVCIFFLEISKHPLNRLSVVSSIWPLYSAF